MSEKNIKRMKKIGKIAIAVLGLLAMVGSFAGTLIYYLVAR